MKKLIKLFLVVFLSIFILNFNVDSQDSNISEADTDKSCTGKQVKIYSPDPSDYQKIPEDKAMQSENYLSRDNNTCILKPKPKAVSEYKDVLKNSQEIDPDELELPPENIKDFSSRRSGEFLADYDVILCTEADCNNIQWSLNGQSAGAVSCGIENCSGFRGVPAGTYTLAYEGCGVKQEGSLNVTGDYVGVICPEHLDMTECCPEGLDEGEYVCDDCQGTQPTTTTTTPGSSTTTTTTVNTTTTTAGEGYSSVYLCTETACEEGFEWTFAGQRHPDSLDCSTLLIFGNVPEGCYTSFVSGCGWVWEMDICVDGNSDKHYYLCPGNTDLDCCEEVGCGLSGGEYDGDFICDGCPSFDISGKIENSCFSNVNVKLSGAIEDTVTTNNNGEWEFVDVPGGGPYYVAPQPGGCECEPPQLTISDLDSDLSGLSFSCYEPAPPICNICPLLCLFGENSEEAEALRDFRDEVLSKSPVGQEIIKLYYQWSPVISQVIEEDEEFREELKEMIDGILPLIRTEKK